MSICGCKHHNCQYETFLNKQIDNIDYFKENKCIFHSETLQKEEKEKFLAILQKYIKSQHKNSKKVLLKDTVFYAFKIDVSTVYDEIMLEEVTFECYPNFDYLQCSSLIFKECSFHEGGRFKRVKIDSLELRLRKVENALVFEMGGYAKDGLIETSDSYIHKITKYTNHVAGSGKVFFVGAKFEKEANFTNAMLDDVVFQNCDLSKVRFLNSKVDKTEFRNCTFLKNKTRKNFDELENGIWKYGIIIASIILGMILYWFESYVPYPLFVILVIFIFFGVSTIFMYLFGNLYSFVYSLLGDNEHICTYDEKEIFTKMDFFKKSMTKETRAKLKDSLLSLYQLYLSLQVNFESKKDIQRGGDFFYSRRYIQLLSLRSGFDNLVERAILIFHFSVNGFGERMGRPMLWLSIITMVAVMLVNPNEDFIATKATPLFLLEEEKNITSKNVIPLYTVDVNKSARFLGVRNTGTYTIVAPKLKANDVPKFYGEMNNRILFVLSRYINIVVPQKKAWFKSVSKTAHFVSTIVGIFSWFFIGAFLLALRNRIRRK